MDVCFGFLSRMKVTVYLQLFNFNTPLGILNKAQVSAPAHDAASTMLHCSDAVLMSDLIFAPNMNFGVVLEWSFFS